MRAARPTTPKSDPAGPPGSPPSEFGEVLEFMRRLWAVDHGLQSMSKFMELHHGVTGPQRTALRLLGYRPQITAGELAELMHVHPSTLTGVLRRLEERGYIVREIDDNDRRRTLLRLTAAGRQINVAQPGTIEASITRVLNRVGPKQLATAATVLQALADELVSGE